MHFPLSVIHIFLFGFVIKHVLQDDGYRTT